LGILFDDVSRSEGLFSSGQMGARIAAFDWSQTPAGALRQWSQSLKTSVRIMLNSRYPMFIWWGAELINIYNDAYIPMLGKRHPEALGQRAPKIWADIWNVVGPQSELVMKQGQATWNDEVLLVMERNDFTEETYFTFSYSPIIEEAGNIVGLLGVCTEDTAKVLGRRRLKTLRDLGERTLAEVKTAEDAVFAAAETLAENPTDVPFALIYLLNDSGTTARLAQTVRMEKDKPVAPLKIDVDSKDDVWQFKQVLETGTSRIIENLADMFGVLTAGAWLDDATERAIVVPLAKTGVQDYPAGFLVAGISPRLSFDDDYRGFLELVAGHVATSIAKARGLEQERKRAELLAELDRAKTTFFSNVSHEFRTPLTLMLGPLKDAIDRCTDSKVAMEYEQLSVIHRNGLRLLKLVNTLLDFSRIEARRMEPVYEPIDLAAFTADLASVFRAAVEKAGLRLIVNCPQLAEPIYVDRDMWEKIVLNLLSNAFKFTLEGEIEVTLKDTGDRVELSVRDSGPGIPESEVGQVFDRFYRVKGTQGRTHEGTGIGLALVQELAKLHGGSIKVDSVFGQGSTFVVSLPKGRAHLPEDRIEGVRTLAPTPLGAGPFIEEALRWLPEVTNGVRNEKKPSVYIGDSTQTAAVQRRTHGTDGARIVLADDNADMRDYVQRLLGERYHVEAVPDGLAALKAVREHVPDLVLCDVMMPNLDGFGLLKELRNDPQLNTVPVIMLSARAGEESSLEGLAAGADDYLIKPFSARELSARVRSQLEMAYLRRQAEQSLRESQRRLQQALAAAKEANQLKDEFLATVSHELRTPLQAILSWASLLRSPRMDGVDLSTGLESIYRSAKNQAQTIEDLLDISRIVTGKLQLKPQRVLIDSVVLGAAEAISPALQAKGIGMRMRLSEESSGRVVYGDPDRLQQVFWNLLSNAMKFTSEGGSVEIATHIRDKCVEVTVSDTGKGIVPEFLPFVFDRFRQADASSTRRVGGLGLGLSIVRHLVELHGGDVEARSEGEGKGSTFIISLPVLPSSSIARSERRALGNEISSSSYHPLAGVRVLLVDDEPESLLSLETSFLHASAEVKSAGSAREALEILSIWTPDVCVTDIGMPEEDGYAFVQKVLALNRQSEKQISMLALTAYAREEDRARILSSGFHMFLPKPLEAAEVVSAVATLARSLQGKKILLVEDDLLSAEVLRSYLASKGAEAKIAMRSKQALGILDQWTPDILVSDLGLPEQDGFSLIQAIRSSATLKLASLPAIAMTGYGREEGERALAAGFHLYLVKPIEPGGLEQAILPLLSRSPSP
jgi:signal transduction histidine kinase